MAERSITERELQAKPPWRSAWWIGISAALGAGVGIGLVGSIASVFYRNRLATDAFELLFVTSTVAYLLLIAVKTWLKSRSGHGGAPVYAKIVYSFPRRFGLGTLLVLTLAFGVLTAF